MSWVGRLEFWHNKASDTNFVWFPFLFLKPAPHSKIEVNLKIKMIACFGIYYGVFAALRSWVFSKTTFLQCLGQDILLATCFFAIWFNVVTAPLWNLRAHRLTNGNLTKEKT